MDRFAGIFNTLISLRTWNSQPSNSLKRWELAFFHRLITRPTVSNIEASPLRQTFYAFAWGIKSTHQQHDHQPSIYRDMFNEGEFGLHHIARLEADYEGAKSVLDQQGFEKRVSCMPMVCGLAITTRSAFIILLKFTQSPINFDDL